VSSGKATVEGVSFRPQINAHIGTNTTISATVITRAGPAIDLTFPCSRRIDPPAWGESRRSMRDESDSRHAQHRSRCARPLGVLPFAARGGSQRTPPPPPERNQRLAAGGVCQLRRHTAVRVTAERAAEILGERISDQHRRTRTGMSVARPHSWPPVRSVPRAHARGRESPQCRGTTWRRPIGRRSRHRLGRRVSDRPPLTLHVFAHSTQRVRARHRFIQSLCVMSRTRRH
jgi:hypothetical protein